MNNTYTEYKFRGMNAKQKMFLYFSVILILLVFIILVNTHVHFFGKSYLAILAVPYFIVSIAIYVVYCLVYIKLFMILYKICLNPYSILIYYNGKLKAEISFKDIYKIDLLIDKELYRSITIYYCTQKQVNIQVGDFEKEVVEDFENFIDNLDTTLLDLNFTKKEELSKDNSAYTYSLSENKT